MSDHFYGGYSRPDEQRLPSDRNRFALFLILSVLIGAAVGVTVGLIIPKDATTTVTTSTPASCGRALNAIDAISLQLNQAGATYANGYDSMKAAALDASNQAWDQGVVDIDQAKDYYDQGVRMVQSATAALDQYHLDRAACLAGH